MPVAELNVRGIRLYYEERGEGAPIVLIHGTSSSASIWGEAVLELSKLGRLITYDRRGCYRSERPDPYLTTSVAEHTDDAATLLEALRATPAIVIGRSYGGGIAIDLALRYPDRVRALVLLEAGVLGLSPDADRWVQDLTVKVQAAAAQDPRTVGERFIKEVIGDAGWAGLPERLKRMFTDNGPAILAELAGGDLAAEAAALSAVGHRTLVVGAAESPPEFHGMTDRIAEAIPDSQLVLVEGGHLVDPSHPEVVRFVQGVLSGE